MKTSPLLFIAWICLAIGGLLVYSRELRQQFPDMSIVGFIAFFWAMVYLFNHYTSTAGKPNSADQKSESQSTDYGPPKSHYAESKILSEVQEFLGDLPSSSQLLSDLPEGSWKADAYASSSNILVEISKDDEQLGWGEITDPTLWLQFVVPPVSQILARHLASLSDDFVVRFRVISGESVFAASCNGRKLALQCPKSAFTASEFASMMSLLDFD